MKNYNNSLAVDDKTLHKLIQKENLRNHSSFYNLQEEMTEEILLNIWNKSIKQIRFSGNKKIICKYFLWFLAFEGKIDKKSFILNRKIKELNLEEYKDFLIQYCYVVFRKTIQSLRLNARKLANFYAIGRSC